MPVYRHGERSAAMTMNGRIFISDIQIVLHKLYGAADA